MRSTTPRHVPRGYRRTANPDGGVLKDAPSSQADVSAIFCRPPSALASGCSSAEKEAEPVVVVQVATVKQASIEKIVNSEAVLFPLQQAAITPKVSAPVKRFLVNRGDRVKAGQLLAVLENQTSRHLKSKTRALFRKQKPHMPPPPAPVFPKNCAKRNWMLRQPGSHSMLNKSCMTVARIFISREPCRAKI